MNDDQIFIQLRALCCCAHIEPFYGPCNTCKAANEIELLRQWKSEAIEILKQWDAVADMVPVRLGDKKSDAVAAEIERLRSGMDQLSEALGRFVSAGLQLEEELSEKRAFVDQLQVEVEESDQLIRRSADLLNGVANALHRGPLENGLWSWHDLPSALRPSVLSLTSWLMHFQTTCEARTIPLTPRGTKPAVSSDDIVTRLRNSCAHKCSLCDRENAYAVGNDAVECIRAQQAEIERLRAAVDAVFALSDDSELILCVSQDYVAGYRDGYREAVRQIKSVFHPEARRG